MTDAALGYFYEAASLGSMRLASDKIGVAVSSISRQIAQLEREYGMPLIERGRRSIRMTPAGEMVFDYYRSRLADRESLINRIGELRNLRTGLVELAVGEGFLNRSFTEVIDQFQGDHPGVQVTITSGGSADVIRMVAEDEAHIGLVFHGVEDAKVRVRASARQPLMVVCAADHRLAARETVSLRDLTEETLCLPPKGFRIRQMLAAAEAREHVWLKPATITSSIHVMRELAKLGQAVTLLPEISVLSDVQDGLLVARPLADADLEQTTVQLVHRMGRQLDGPPARMMAILEVKVRKWVRS